MKKITISLSIFAVSAVALYGGIIAYNSNNIDRQLFIQNVEALADKDESDDGETDEDDWVWDFIEGCFVPAMPYYAPKF